MQVQAPRAPRSTGRWLRRAASVALSLQLAYLVLGNLLLNTQVGRDLANRQPEKFAASWAKAWTLYPGHVHVEDLRIAGHVRRVVWSVQADSAHGRIAILPLLARQAHLPRLAGTGVTGGATHIDIELVPPPARPGGWTLRFDEIVADDVRYAYFNDLVLEGRGQGRCGFAKTLRGGPMQLMPSEARFEQGALWRDGARLAWDTTIGAEFSIDRHRREEAPGIRKLEKTDLALHLESTTVGLSLENDGGGKPVMRLSEGPGTLHTEFRWDHGALTRGGKLRLSLPVAGRLDGAPHSTLASVDVQVADDEIRLKGELKPASNASVEIDTDVTVKGTRIPVQDFAALVPRTSGHFVSRWHFDSLAWLTGFVPGHKLVAFDGAGTVLADLRVQAGELVPGSSIEVPHVAATATALGNRFDGDAWAKVTFEPAGQGQLEPRLQAVMEQFSIAPTNEPEAPYVHGTNLHIDAISRGDAGTLDDKIHARLQFRGAQVPDLRVYNRYLPKTNLRITGGEARVSGDLQFDREGGVDTGDFQVVGRDVQIGLGALGLRGDIDIATKLQRTDVRAHAFDADGSRILLKGVRVTDGDELLAADWWSELSLDEARLDWDRPMALDGSLRVRMKDLGVLLALYSQRKDLPAWVGKLIDEGEADAAGRVVWQREALLIDPLTANNDRFEVLARLRVQEKHPTGDLFAKWGVLSLGVELADDKRHLHLVGARKWFDGQQSLAGR